MVICIILRKLGFSIIKLLIRPASAAGGHGCFIQYLFYVNTILASLVSFGLYVIVVNVVDPLTRSSIIHLLYTFSLLKIWRVLLFR